MFAHFAPGGAAPTTVDLRPELRGDPLPHATVGRGAEQDLRLSGLLVSKHHGAFTRDSHGVLRYVDLGSRHGSALLPARGAARALQPRRPVALLPGDAVALGGLMPPDLSRESAMLTMHVLERLPELTAAAPPAAPPEPPASPGAADALAQLLACPICQETLRGARVVPCGHVFCDDCLSRWFRERTSCPTCRAACDPASVATAGVPCLTLDAAAAMASERAGDERAAAAHREYAAHGGIKRRKVTG
jgi:hypothetical protein